MSYLPGRTRSLSSGLDAGGGVLRLGLVALLAVLSGCAAIIETPPQPPSADARAVFLLDHGRHSSLVIARDGDAMVRYGYGEWRWYALGETGCLRMFPALFMPTRAAFGRRVHAGPAEVETVLREVRVEIREVRQMHAHAAAADALMAQLDALFEAQSDTLHYNALHDLQFVHHPERYSFRNNSNHYVAAWLRELGIEVRGSPMLGRWRMED